jgi:serine/threonine-protein kinase
MAQVFIAQKDNAPEICVLKQLLGELETHATAGKRFYREAHVASYLQHPRIARTIDAGFEDGAFCIAMEFIAGRDVESLMHLLMRQGRMLPYELSLAVALGVLEGLEYAHEALDPTGAPLDLVHRDLSPRNVMLSFDGDVKIIDFGLARGKVDDFKTAPGMILGTLRYVSPEQAVADPIDRRSDLYSIAVVLYEMLTGRPLVRDGTALDVLTDVVQRVPDAICARNPHLPRSLDPVLARALAKDPADRYASAREFRVALEAAAGGLARAPRSAIGEFVTSHFPEDRTRALEQIELGRRRYAEQIGRGARALGQATLASESGPDDLGSRTRTGFVDTASLGGEDLVSATRTGWMTPGGLAQSDEAAGTRTIFEPRFVDPATRAAASPPAYDAPLPPTSADHTRVTPPDGRTAVLDVGARTLVFPGSPPPPSAALVRPASSVAPLIVLGLALATTLAAVVYVAVEGASQEVDVIAATDDTLVVVPASAAPVAPAVGATAAPVARPLTTPVATPGATSVASASPTPPAKVAEAPAIEAPRPAAPRLTSPSPVPSPSTSAAEARRAPTAEERGAGEAGARRRTALAKVRSILGDIDKFEQDWDSLDGWGRSDQRDKVSASIRELSPDATTRQKIDRLLADSRVSGDVGDINNLRQALKVVEEALPR